MNADMKPYPAYKDSGVEWLGDVPEHWDIRKLRHILKRFTKRNQPDLPLLSVVREKGVIKRDLKSKDDNHNFIPEDLSNYKVVLKGQFAMNKMKAWQGSYGISQFEGIVSPAYFVFELNDDVGDFFHVAIRSKKYIPFFTQASDGVRIGQWDLVDSRMKEIPFFIPPLPEQTAIVRYLDYMDRRIRRYINAKKKLIALLEEEKQAIIHNAVTRGLDPDVRLKPSGVEWLGDVPEHWEVVSVKRHYDIKLGKMLQNSQNNKNDIEVSYLKAQHVQWFRVQTTNAPKMWASPREIDQYQISNGDLLVCEGGEGGRCGIVKDLIGHFIIQNALHRVRAALNSRNEFLQYVMITISSLRWFDAINNKATIAHFTGDKFGSLRIPIPPLPEQTAIISYLDQTLERINSTITHAQHQIALLQEYRTRLIADVVTGKLDVREAAAHLPEENKESGENKEGDTGELFDELDSIIDDEISPEEMESECESDEAEA